MKTVADAGPLVTFVDQDDRAHRLARSIISDLGRDLLVPDAVVVEVDYLLRRRISHAVARAFLEDLMAGALTRVPIAGALFERAVEYDRRYADLGLGIADASVMALAEAERAPVLTFDFADFRAAPPLRGGHWRLLVDEDLYRRATGR